MIHEAKDLLEAIEKFEISADGDSDDKEHDSAVEMATAARTFLLKTAERNVELADLIDKFAAREASSNDTKLRLRRERIDYYLPETSVARLDNEYPIPEKPGRYFAIEKSDGESVWAMDAETLDELIGRIQMHRATILALSSHVPTVDQAPGSVPLRLVIPPDPASTGTDDADDLPRPNGDQGGRARGRSSTE